MHNSLVQNMYCETKNVYLLRMRKWEMFYVDLQATIAIATIRVTSTNSYTDPVG